MKISEPTKSDIAYVAYRMRETDLREFSAVSRFASQEAMVHDLVERFGNDADCIVACDDFPVAVGLVVEHRPHVVTLGFFATDEFPSIAVPLTRFIRQRLFKCLKNSGVHRIEAISIDGYWQAHRWLRAIGLHHEAEHKGFGKNRETFHTFAWTA